MLIATWLNGNIINCLDVQERAFAYGDGVFSTILVQNGSVKLLDLHWKRIVLGCQRLAIALTNITQWQNDFAKFISQYSNCTAKIIITRGCGGRGYLPDIQAEPHCYFYAYQTSTHPNDYQLGIKSDFLHQRLGCNPLLAGMKHLNRLEQVLLRQELAQLAHPEALVCDIQGRVIEGVFSNVFMIKEAVLYTPDLHQAGVAGVMREHILQLARSLQWTVCIQDLYPEQFLAADEVFFCNSVYGLWPVKQIQGTIWPSTPLTQHLQANLYHV
jgi:4-amino-4-deoxychorismate lyase